MSMLRRLFTSLPKVCKPHSMPNILPKTARCLPQHSGIYKPTFFFSESSKQPDAEPKGIKFDLNDPLPDNVEIDVDGKTIKTKDGKVVYEIPSEVKGATLGDSERYLIMMTCNICNNKMQKTFTKKSYHTGVVLVTCDSCENIHLIADNLGWFRDTPVNVEDLAKEKGNQAVKISNNARLQQILQNIKYVGYKDTIDPAKQSEAENSSEQNGTVAQLGEAEGDKNKK